MEGENNKKEIPRGGHWLVISSVAALAILFGCLLVSKQGFVRSEGIIVEQESGANTVIAQVPKGDASALIYAKNLSDIEKNYIEQIKIAVGPLQDKLKHHPLYGMMKIEENVITFMNTHVYCVWDFMNLVKRLQLYLTSVEIPWRPTSDFGIRILRRLINEIVLEEETDELSGAFISHFSYYVASIRQVQGGALSKQLNLFLQDLSNSNLTYDDIVDREYLPIPVRNFLQSTKYYAVHDNILVTAAAFTFGREVLLPEIFTSILRESGIATKPRLAKFVNYLDRHIELDGDIHGYLSKKMVLKFAFNQADWDLVIDTAKTALEARLELWDAIYHQLL